MITKRLIYHFYVSPEWETNPVYKMHQYLLRKYSKVFNEATFVLSIDNVNDKEGLKKVERFLLDCDFKNIEFRVEQNNALYEVSTFKKYIVNNMKNLDGMTFFAHSKGVIDIARTESPEDILFWTFLLYYLSLEYYKEGEKMMFSTTSVCLFYGSILGMFNEHSPEDWHFPINNAMYIGTFYWLNCKEIYHRHKDNIPEICNRFYAENFPGNIAKPLNFELYSHSNRLISEYGTKNYNIYNGGSKIYGQALLSESEYKEAIEEFNLMIDNLGIRDIIR